MKLRSNIERLTHSSTPLPSELNLMSVTTKKSLGADHRSASNESINTVYLSCFSTLEDERLSPVSQYYSCSSSKSFKSKPSSWGQSILELGKIKFASAEKKPVEPSTSSAVKYYYLMKDGSELSMIYGGPGDSLVQIHGTTGRLPGNIAFNTASLPQPIYMFNTAVKWHHAARIMMVELPDDGIYFAGICWKFRRPYERSDGSAFDAKESYVLNCFCKEPQRRFQGRVGPISVFVPHHKENIDKRIAGIWVSLFSDQILAEYFEERPFFEPEYRSKLKAVDESYEQMMFFVSDSASCVGIQVLHTKQEEKQIKKLNKEYHHGRPLILQDGFYLVEGKFTTNFLNEDNSSQFNLDCSTSSGPKIIILGEGTHMIRTETVQNNPGHKPSTKKRAHWRLNRRKRRIRKPSLPKSNKSSSTGKSGTKVTESGTLSSLSEEMESKSEKQSDKPGWKDGKIRKVEVCIDKRYERLIVLDQNVLKEDFEQI
ncbi:hypothetical protein TYRP_023615 [Tyrophagus putrescentiae]|nr:hypothetical protein TYRP_012370 [Tyrophagus putrescentiae]KAH9410486.1 hypothetical protein TYRP_023615 [Tyrophagus putrescentiae]